MVEYFTRCVIFIRTVCNIVGLHRSTYLSILLYCACVDVCVDVCVDGKGREGLVSTRGGLPVLSILAFTIVHLRER